MIPANRLLLGSVSGAPMFELISQSRMITFGSGLVTHAQARSLCASKGGRLPQLTSWGRNEELRTFALGAGVGGNIWLDAQEAWAGDSGEGSWVWKHDGTSIPSGSATTAQGNSRYAFWDGCIGDSGAEGLRRCLEMTRCMV